MSNVKNVEMFSFYDWAEVSVTDFFGRYYVTLRQVNDWDKIQSTVNIFIEENKLELIDVKYVTDWSNYNPAISWADYYEELAYEEWPYEGYPIPLNKYTVIVTYIDNN